ncbi:MAG: amidase [Chloroflexi bacterium]|nr:amidase [Chloroflexota bacterium]
MRAVADSAPWYWDAERLAAAYRSGETDPVEVTELFLTRIAEIDPSFNSYRLATAPRARADAEAARRRLRAGAPLGPLDGIPIALKDLIDTAGIETTYGSRILCGRIPAADAAVARRLRSAGTVLLGKLHLLEFAMGSVTGNAYFGPCRNPWNRDHFSGGSSTGSGSAVAAGIVLGALGTDTSGSIRQPAAWCGVVGLKPTNGSINLAGIFPLSPTCDTVGPLARTVADAALLLDAIADHPAGISQAARPRSLAGIKIGVPETWVAQSVTDQVADAYGKALGVLDGLGADLLPVEPGFIEDEVTRTYQSIVLYEAANAHRAWYPERAADYAPYLRGNIEAGRRVSKEGYAAAIERRGSWRERTALALADVAAVVTPTQPTEAPQLNCDIAQVAGQAVSSLAIRGRFTMPWSVVGWPALSLPGGYSRSGLPIGIQFAAPPGAESQLFAIAASFEGAAPHGMPHPVP